MAALPSVSDLLSLDVEQRMDLIRVLWNSIADAGDALPLADRDRAILDERLASHARDPDAGSTWDEVSARLVR